VRIAEICASESRVGYGGRSPALFRFLCSAATQIPPSGAPHAVVTVTDSRKGCLGAALDEIGAKVNVVSASSELLSVLASAASAPVVATVPTRMAQRYGPRFGLTLSSAPLKLRLPASSVVWSGRLDQDPASCWIRKQVADLVLEQTVEKAVA
jgi:DNA-binding transcriptional LysR family regulator